MTLLPGESIREGFKAGDLVWWRHEIRGGYGGVVNVRATVLEQTAQRVRIRIEKDGRTKTVSPWRLDRRDPAER